jgi:hypothetical protein
MSLFEHFLTKKEVIMELKDVLTDETRAVGHDHEIMFLSGQVEPDHDGECFRLYRNPANRRAYALIRKDQVAGDIYQWAEPEMVRHGYTGAKIYRIPLKKGTFITEVKAQAVRLEDSIHSIADEAQLSAIDLQNMLQKQSQTLEMMSNISKMLHDTAMAVIKKIG